MSADREPVTGDVTRPVDSLMSAADEPVTDAVPDAAEEAMRLFGLTEEEITARKAIRARDEAQAIVNREGVRADPPVPPVLFCRRCDVELSGDIWVHRSGRDDWPNSMITEILCGECAGKKWRGRSRYASSWWVEIRCAWCHRVRHVVRPINNTWTDSVPQIRATCSEECRAEQRNTKRRHDRTRTDRTCDQCGQPFTATRKDARYCSPRCRQTAYRARAKA